MGFRIDNQTQFSGGEIDHSASAKENLQAAGQDLKMMLPDKTFDAIKLYAEAASIRDLQDWGYDTSDMPNPYKLLFKSMIMFPVGLVRDAVELIAGPVLALKDGADAAVHGILAGQRRAEG